MRFITAIAISATAALASSTAMMSDTTTAMMVHESAAAAASSVMAHESVAAVTSSMMARGSVAAATSSMMARESVAAVTSSMMAYGTASSIMVHETTAMAAYTASAAAPQASGGPVTHTVIVGGTAGLVYTPSQLTAKVNDVVHFVFMSQNHTATESTFALPCNKQATGSPDSGFQPNPNNTVVPAPSWDYTVTSTDPTWWYCKQRTGTHCGKGMVFAINPTAEKSFDTFKAAAISINGTTATVTGSTTTMGFTMSAVGTVTLIADSSAAATATALVTDSAAAATATAMPVVKGWNEGGVSCQCACFCGVAAYPSGAGIGAFGGYGGSLPAPW